MKKLFFAMLLTLFASLSMAQVEIKFASVAPEGTAWMKAMRQIAKEVGEKTNNQVSFKFYAGGVQGDEADMLRKIRVGQLHAGGFTGNGLGEIYPATRVLEVPYLFDNETQLDSAVAAIEGDLRKGFDEKGFILLGWADVGFVHFFSREKIASSSDLNGKKVWMWQGDPLASALFKAYGITPIPLSLPDVMTALQTNMVDVVYASPVSGIALQWQTRTKYFTEQPVTYASGAVLLSKKIFEKLSPSQQQTLLSVAKQRLNELTTQTRKDNKAAIKTLQSSGMQVTPAPSLAEQAKMREIGIRTRNQLVGTLFSRELLKKVEDAVSRAKTVK